MNICFIVLEKLLNYIKKISFAIITTSRYWFLEKCKNSEFKIRKVLYWQIRKKVR